jgi:hypothetical protein
MLVRSESSDRCSGTCATASDAMYCGPSISSVGRHMGRPPRRARGQRDRVEGSPTRRSDAIAIPSAAYTQCMSEASKKEPSRRFRLALRPTLIGAVLAQAPFLAVAACFPSLRTARILLSFALYPTFLVVLSLSIGQVVVTADGLTLYWVNVLPWDKIERVALSRVFGLRYLKVHRKNAWLPWWFPLYLADEDGFRRAVIERAPTGNPFRAFFEGEGPKD